MSPPKTSSVLNLRMIGFRLSELRTRRHLSQQKLGELAGVRAYTIGRYERGESCPPLGTVVRLCLALEASLDFVVLGEPRVVVDKRLLSLWSAIAKLSPEGREAALRILELVVEQAVGADKSAVGIASLVPQSSETRR